MVILNAADLKYSSQQSGLRGNFYGQPELILLELVINKRKNRFNI